MLPQAQALMPTQLRHHQYSQSWAKARPWQDTGGRGRGSPAQGRGRAEGMARPFRGEGDWERRCTPGQGDWERM